MGKTDRKVRLIAAASLSVFLAACGGSGGGSSTASNNPGTPDGVVPPGSADSPVANAKPTIQGTPATAVLANSDYAFQPAAKDANGDVLTFHIQNPPPWAKFDIATGELQGKPAASDIGTYGNIVISVTDGAADASLQAFSISVQQVGSHSIELDWQAPTQNADGSPLSDLAGFKLYWGTKPGDYTNSVTIDNPGVVTYLVDNLVSNTYYFVATAFNTEGNESAPSEMATAAL